MANDCLTKLTEFFKDKEIPTSALKAILADMEKIKADVEAGKYPGETYRSKAAEYLAERRRLNEAQLLIRAENLRKIKTSLDFYSQPGFADDVSEAFKAQLDKSVKLANSAGDSISARSAGRFESYANYAFGALHEQGNAEVFMSGQLDKEIMQEVHALSTGNHTGVSGNKQAGDIAGVVHNLNKMFFKEMRDAGIPIRELNGFIMRQTHDAFKVGGVPVDEWISKTLPLLDKERTFGLHATDPKAIETIMKRIHSDIRAGVYGLDSIIGDKEVGDNFVGLGATKSLADKLSEARTLHFSNPDNAYNYNLEFGKGNVAETLYAEMRRNSTALSLFERLGDKPQAAFEANIDRMVSKLRKEGSTSQVDKLLSQKPRLLALYKDVAGVHDTPGSETVAKIGAGIRTVEALSKLAYVGVRSFANLAGAAVELKNSTGQNILQTTGGFFKNWLQEIPESFREVYGKKAATFISDMQAQQIQSMGITGDGPLGRMNKLSRLMMKYNGQDFINNSFTKAMSNMIQESYAENVGKAFNQLDPKMQAGLLNSGISAEEFKLFSKAVETSDNGRKFVTPEAISKLTKEDVSDAMKATNFKGSSDVFIKDLELKLRGHLIQAANIATTTAGARERSALNFGTDPGTLWGETARLFTQFKSFSLQSFNIAQKFLNSNPNLDMLEKGILKSQSKDMRSLAEWVVMGSMLAYGGDTLLRAVNGKEPRDPLHPETWIDSMAKSGAGGIYVDFIAGEWNKYDFGQNLLGPTFGQVPAVAKMVSDLKEGDFKGGKFNAGSFSTGVVPGATQLVRNNIPFQQVPLIKQGLDFIQWKVIDEALHPGAGAKRELRKLKQQLIKQAGGK